MAELKTPNLLLKSTDLCATRSGRRVFEGLSFTVSAGEALILKGPNGSGKSTLLRILAGFGEAAGGSIELVGGDPERRMAESCHYVAHADALKVALTARENLSFWAEYHGGGEPLAALEALGIGHLANIPSGLLSAGQKRRLGLARLMLSPRDVWLLDEPAVSLDTASQDRLAGLMAGHVADGGIVVAATHMPLGINSARELELGPYKARTGAGP
ncbi:ABC transporter involved in cytochrome c biogenesis, ATPase component CcmA [hydrothermal vent metagenome]|uniref:ABC transporter involved in cytochrome c biogenesis, ATPase component CcmA n=1 Tax=hydrothermal vent metagenome TaxID=652676 RepID=A0A3B0SAT0_9ZZZZ